MIEHHYKEIQGWMDFEDVYRDAVANCPDNGTIVEVGCWKGKSLSFLLVEAANSGKDLRIIGVDHFMGSVGEPDLIMQAQTFDLAGLCNANCSRAGYPYRLYSDPSVKAVEKFADGSIDFCFLDASHDEASVIADIKAWLPKVKPGGILAGHDRGYTSVDAAITKLLPGFQESRSCWLYRVPIKEKKNAKAQKQTA